MLKRGQVTIFIIIAILIVAVVVIFFMFRDNLGIGSSLPSYAENVYTFTQSCIEDSAKEVIYDVGQGGGYYKYRISYKCD